jgi:hypothetical protein
MKEDEISEARNAYRILMRRPEENGREIVGDK